MGIILSLKALPYGTVLPAQPSQTPLGPAHFKINVLSIPKIPKLHAMPLAERYLMLMKMLCCTDSALENDEGLLIERTSLMQKWCERLSTALRFS
jgi:hypothetical protein